MKRHVKPPTRGFPSVRIKQLMRKGQVGCPTMALPLPRCSSLMLLLWSVALSTLWALANPRFWPIVIPATILRVISYSRCFLAMYYILSRLTRFFPFWGGLKRLSSVWSVVLVGSLFLPVTPQFACWFSPCLCWQFLPILAPSYPSGRMFNPKRSGFKSLPPSSNLTHLYVHIYIYVVYIYIVAINCWYSWFADD